MSKSLGNVLDPFEVIERFGADALRFYCFREVSFGQDGSISPAGFESRYETELANDFGNLASRTLAMIERYRDGVVPDGEVDPALADGEDGLGDLRERVCELLDRSRDQPCARGVLGGGPAAQPLRRGDEAVGAGQGRERERRARPGPLQPRRGPAGGDAPARRVHPESAETLLAALGEEGAGLADFGSRGGGARTERIPPLFPKLDA